MAEEFAPLGSERRRARESENPNVQAEKLLESVRLVTDENGTVYQFTSAYWKEIKDATLLKFCLDKAGTQSRHSFRQEMIHFLKAMTCDPDLKWGRVAEYEIACNNGVVDVRNGTIRKHRPADYLERVLPWNFDPSAMAPTWQQCLIDWFSELGPKAELADALQEFAGYICLSHARYKKALLLHGESDTGKSQVVDAFQQLVGRSFTCQLSVDHMDDPVMRAVIKGKALNVMTELRADAMIADGGFKQLVSTEEPILLNEKFKPAETYTSSAKHVIATNNLPSVNDRTKATFNRLLLIPMTNIISKEKQDRELPEKLRAEMPGILNWAIEGARRLVERRGAWPAPAESVAFLENYRQEQNPVFAWLEECTRYSVGQRTPMFQVRDSFKRWNRGGRVPEQRTLTQMLKNAGEIVERARVVTRDNAVSCLFDRVILDELDLSAAPRSERA